MGFRTVASAAWLRVARRAARSYVAGTELRDAVRACRGLGRRRIAATLCFWNGPGDPPDAIAGEYLAAVESISAGKLDAYLSVKAPPLGFRRDLVSGVFRRAREAGVGVHFDSLGPEHADETFQLIEEFGQRGTGCTLPGRWRRSCADAERARELGLTVRVVKGQWPDGDGLGTNPAAGFLRVVDRLAGHLFPVRVATHDPELAAEALRRLRSGGTPCELELLFGLPFRHMLRVARDAAAPLRIYVPYGSAWLPYALHQARRNPKIAVWILRDLLAGRSMRLPGLDSPAGGD